MSKRMSENFINKKFRLAIITNMPVPYQVDLFNELNQLVPFDMMVFYTRKRSYGRHWQFPGHIQHQHIFIREIRLYKHLYISPGFLHHLKAYQPDMMIVGQYASIAAQSAMYYASQKHIPWVFWAEAPYVKYAEHPIVRNDFFRKVGQFLALYVVRKYATQIWGIGSKAQSIYTQMFPKGEVLNVPYYSNLKPYLNIHRSISHKHPVRFLFAGSLSYRKGFDLLAEAAKILHMQGYQFEIHIAGKGALKNLIDKMPNSIYHGFVQPGDALFHLFNSCDVLVFPSRYDGWGLSVIEGLAAGMPVISGADVGAAIDAIRPGENGWILSQMNANDLAKKMRWFLESPDKVAEMIPVCRSSIMPYDISNGAKYFIRNVNLLYRNNT